MKAKELIDELNTFLKILDSMYDINSGGCFYVAYLIALFSIKTLEYNVWFCGISLIFIILQLNSLNS